MSLLGKLTYFLGLQISQQEITSQLHQGNAKKIQNGILQTHPYSNGNRLQIDNRRII